jgi:hypothetical protein
VATLEQLWVIFFEPSTKDQNFGLCAFFWQESLLPQGYDPLPSLAVFQFGGAHTSILHPVPFVGDCTIHVPHVW